MKVRCMAYYRLESDTQTVEIAALQEASLEVWGREPRGSDILQVQAFKGFLPDAVRGIEFDAHIVPDPSGHPFIANWSGERPGIFARSNDKGDFVAINVFDFKNSQKDDAEA